MKSEELKIKMADDMLQIGQAVAQHGTSNDRVYVMRMGDELPERVFPEIEQLARQKNYGKIFAKVPASAAGWLLDRGYVEEARIPGYFMRQEDACLMSRFLKPDRAVSNKLPELPRLRSNAPGSVAAMSKTTVIRPAHPDDVNAMAALFSRVFPSYPFPIHQPEYLLNTMRDNVRYFLIEDNGQLVALSSGEIDKQAKAVEMTDFATLPSYRAKGLAGQLLSVMEKQLSADGLLTAYTIARAVSAGINRLFFSAGYTFGGTLVNNTQISGGIESMRVWHKPLIKTLT